MCKKNTVCMSRRNILVMGFAACEVINPLFFSFIDRVDLRVLLGHRTPEKVRELFNLFFHSFEGILRHEVQ